MDQARGRAHVPGRARGATGARDELRVVREGLRSLVGAAGVGAPNARQARAGSTRARVRRERARGVCDPRCAVERG